MVRVRELAKQHLSLFLAEQTAISLLRPDMPADSELLKVAIIGAPNAGKSTFVNRLMGWRVSLSNKQYIFCKIRNSNIAYYISVYFF
jgi:predicted GTPase